MRRTSRGGWLSRLAAKRQKSWVWHPEFEPQNRKPGKSAPVTPCECRAEHGAPDFPEYSALTRMELAVHLRGKARNRFVAHFNAFTRIAIVSNLVPWRLARVIHHHPSRRNGGFW